MRALTAWFIRNSVAANLLMGFILFMGVITLITMRVEGFPRIESDRIIITTVFPGAPPAKVDALVSQKIETALEGLEGVRSFSAVSTESLSIITIRRVGDYNLDKLLDQVRMRMDSGIELPARVDSHKLRQLNLTVPDVVERIRASSLEFQAGSLKTSAGSIFIRADGKAQYAPLFMIPMLRVTIGSALTASPLLELKYWWASGKTCCVFQRSPSACCTTCAPSSLKGFKPMCGATAPFISLTA